MNLLARKLRDSPNTLSNRGRGRDPQDNLVVRPNLDTVCMPGEARCQSRESIARHLGWLLQSWELFSINCYPGHGEAYFNSRPGVDILCILAAIMSGLTWEKRLAVCSWSLQPENAIDLLDKVQQTGIRRIQCALDPLCQKPELWSNLHRMSRDRGIEIISGMFGTIGEDYSTLDSIRETGGVVPDHTWEANWKHIQSVAVLAEQMGLRLITFHAGFLPHNPSDPAFAKLRDRIRRISDLFAAKGIGLAMETGQETAETLKDFLQQLSSANVGVNFDPANLILYDKGEPIQAMRTLGPWIRQCHVKDAVRTKIPGTWGEEVVVGTGQVDWRAFLLTLQELGFQGNLVIEREAGSQRIQDIQAARRAIESAGR